jgi:ribosome maturation protein SDO1
VSEKERHQQLDNLSKEIATVIADKCVNPETKRPYTVTMIENAIKEVHYSINSTKGAKQQALEVIKLLQTSGTLPIQRAEMKVRIDIPLKDAKRIKDKVHKLLNKAESEEYNTGSLEIVCLFFI